LENFGENVLFQFQWELLFCCTDETILPQLPTLDSKFEVKNLKKSTNALNIWKLEETVILLMPHTSLIMLILLK
jgi:hypothetical protein